MNEISEKYKKYIVGIKLDGENKLLISGMDISKGEEDFLLSDRNGKILLFDDITQIEYYIQNANLLDENNFKRWISELKHKEPYIIYDIDNIINKIEKVKDFRELNKDMLSNIVDLINIIGDYAYQINRGDLQVIYENPFIDQFKEIFMNDYIWETNIRDEAVNNFFPWEMFRIAFKNLINLFKQYFYIYRK